MLKSQHQAQPLYGQLPRKKIKLNVAADENYNEFKGDICEEPEANNDGDRRQYHKEENVRFANLEEETKRNKSIFDEVKKDQRKVRKINDVKDLNKDKKEMKKDKTPAKTFQSKQPKDNLQKEKIIPEKNKPLPISEVEASKQKQQKKKIQVTGLNNWSQFISQNSTKKDSTAHNNPQSHQSEAIALDCQFVKSGEEQLLARISLVNEKGECLMDSYVRPDKKITDYITDITGITFLHIKNAPKANTVLEQAKKLMYNKIIVGHTVWKDIEVCGLKNWKGWKALVDIAEYQGFKEKNGKLISLKNLSTRYLGRNIQDGRHSSVEDAQATIDLYKLRRMQILKQNKMIV